MIGAAAVSRFAQRGASLLMDDSIITVLCLNPRSLTLDVLHAAACQVSRYIVAQQKRMRTETELELGGGVTGDRCQEMAGEEGRPDRSGAQLNTQAAGDGLSQGAVTPPTPGTPGLAASRLSPSCRSFHGPPYLGILGCQHYQRYGLGAGWGVFIFLAGRRNSLPDVTRSLDPRRKCQLWAPCCDKVSLNASRDEPSAPLIALDFFTVLNTNL